MRRRGQGPHTRRRRRRRARRSARRERALGNAGSSEKSGRAARHARNAVGRPRKATDPGDGSALTAHEGPTSAAPAASPARPTLPRARRSWTERAPACDSHRRSRPLCAAAAEYRAQRVALP
ncbi:hypothetical protein HPB47_007066 [Ixodes persulcatus]|uniref:Uncharacterized protein n=1 Tax=Ixodes persulcatus TaxID=34615 RepID=A0AC60P8N9_IXOPE|nr:hypothetical protein HPB47_007066 [Ixodes persulcatus]